MTREELLKKIKKIDIKTSIITDDFFSGKYRSFFRGNGMEFSNIRKYEIGDDVKRIDWKTSARQRRTYVKEYEEEREISMYILVDVSKSNMFVDKKDKINEIVATIAFSADKNNDKVGLILFSDIIEKFIPIGRGKNHSLKIIEALIENNTKGKGTNISLALDYLNKISKRRGVVFLISDFLDKDYEKSLKISKKKHDLIPIRIKDKKLLELPKGIVFTLEDSETGENITVGSLKRNIKIEEENLKNIIDISTDDDYIKILMEYFKRRSRL